MRKLELRMLLREAAATVPPGPAMIQISCYMRYTAASSAAGEVVTQLNPVLCVSWDPALAETRKLMLEKAGVGVVSVLQTDDPLPACGDTPPQLLILGQSVPRDHKRRIISAFRRQCSAPVLSLLAQNQKKLPEADYGAEIQDPSELIAVVRGILQGR